MGSMEDLGGMRPIVPLRFAPPTSSSAAEWHGTAWQPRSCKPLHARGSSFAFVHGSTFWLSALRGRGMVETHLSRACLTRGCEI